MKVGHIFLSIIRYLVFSPTNQNEESIGSFFDGAAPASRSQQLDR